MNATKAIRKAADLKKGISLQYKPKPMRSYTIRQKIRGKNLWRIDYTTPDMPEFGLCSSGEFNLQELKQSFKIVAKNECN